MLPLDMSPIQQGIQYILYRQIDMLDYSLKPSFPMLRMCGIILMTSASKALT